MVDGMNGLHVVRIVSGTNSQWYEKSRHRSKTLMEKTPSLNEQDFFIRAMYKHSY